ncbi:MAG: PASTA domain-containing protein [Anaerolineae bacterium]
MLAVIAVIGLIPLWLQVYRAYFGAATGRAPTPVPTLTLGQVRVPTLVGFSQEEAQAILQGVGLTMVVNGYQTHPTIKTFAVVNQSVPAGAAINRGENIYVALSRGQDLIEVPPVIGLPSPQAERELQSAGLLVNTRKTWSLEPLGIVLEQNPGPNALLAARSEVTLKVSGGTKITAGANFDNQILLSAYELPRVLYAPNDTISLTLFWRALQRPKQSYTVLLQLTDAGGQIVAEYKSTPAGGTKPTLNWLASQEVLDAYQLIVPPSLAPGMYRLGLGLVEPEQGQPLPIILTGSLQQKAGILILQEIHIN